MRRWVQLWGMFALGGAFVGAIGIVVLIVDERQAARTRQEIREMEARANEAPTQTQNTNAVSNGTVASKAQQTDLEARYAELDKEAIQLLTPYFRECGASTFALHSDVINEYRGLKRGVIRNNIVDIDSLNNVDWKGSVRVTWDAERDRCLNCGQGWREWHRFDDHYLDILHVRHKTERWEKNPDIDIVLVPLDSSQTCDWFQQPQG